MRALLHLCSLLAVVVVASTCFLNSCPYRRYGRALRCASCGPNQSGLCVAENTCCSSEACIPSDECRITSVCPEKFCRLSRLNSAPGFCIAKGQCCNSETCERSSMCL